MQKGRSVLWILGVGLVALVLAAVLALAYYVPRAVQAGRRLMAEEQQRAQVLAAWRAPEPTATAEQVFPADLGPWRRVALGQPDRWPDFPADFTGLGAVYERGGRRVEVIAFRVATLEAEALERRLAEGRSSGGGMRTVLNTPARLLHERERPADRVEVWRGQGWWILFHTPGTTGPLDGLPEAFLAAGR